MMNNQSLREMQDMAKCELFSTRLANHSDKREHTLLYLNKIKDIAFAGVIEGVDKHVFASKRFLENSFYKTLTVVARNPELYGNVSSEDIKRKPSNPRDGKKWQHNQSIWSADADLGVALYNDAKELVKTGKVEKFAAGILCGMLAAGVAIFSPEMRRRTRMESNIDSIFENAREERQTKSNANLENAL